MKTGISGALSTLAFVLVLSATAPAQAQEKVGVVTTVIGPVTVARSSLPPEPLKFKDDVFVRDRVTTGEDAITRILLGGKVIVTARERSTLTITEVPGLSTIHLTGGRIAVAVEKSRMKAGERVDIRTPHAVAGVRGTVLIVEAAPSTSTVTVLRGLVHVTRLNSATGLPVGGFTAVAAQQAVTVRNNVLPARPQAITPYRASELTQEFAPPLKPATPVAVITPSEELKQLKDLAKFDPSSPGSDADTSAAMAVSGGQTTPAGVATPAAAPATASSALAAPMPAAAPAAPATASPALAAPMPAAAPAAPVTASPALAAPMPVVAAPAPMAMPVAIPPAAATAAALVTPPVVPSATPVVTAPAPAAPPTAKTNSPNLGSAWRTPSKHGREGSDSGKR